YLAGPAVLSGIGDRLPHRVSDGVRRDGGARAPRARGRKLACADLARPDRALARRPRPGATGRAQGCAEGIHARGAGPLGDGERYSGRSAAPSRAGVAPLRNAAVVGTTDRAARVPRAGVAGSDYVISRVSSDEGDAQAPRSSIPAADPLFLITHHSSRFQVSKELGIEFFAMPVQNGLRR